jgi:flagella basal body P-ring formation protein FlgA
MTRIVSVLLLLLGLAGFASLPAAAAATDVAAAPALLRSTVTIEAAVIRVGDLFDGGHPDSGLANADVAVARAPAPGESVVLDARWLSAVARAYDVAWRPASRFDQTVVTRASQLVDAETIRAALAADMVARGVQGDFDIQFDGAAPALKLPVDVDPALTIQQLNLDAQSGRFQAVLVAAADGQAAVRAVVSGRVFALTEVPVPLRRLLPGEVITEADLEWVQIRADRISAATVVDPSQIVGHAPRRPIRAGEPVRANDLQIATMMKRGTVVTMVLETAQMLITTQGRVMEDGAAGDLVNVMNITSNRVVKAVVVDPTTVSVAAAMAPLSN